jgi:hypothetical protein
MSKKKHIGNSQLVSNRSIIHGITGIRSLNQPHTDEYYTCHQEKITEFID